MNQAYNLIARFFWPELDTLSEQRRLVVVGDVISFLYSLPFALIGTIWLVLVTDYALFLREWPMLVLFLGLVVLFSRVGYFFIVEIRTDRYGSADGSLAPMVHWSAVLLYGPTALWILLIWQWARYIREFLATPSTTARWNLLRNSSFEQANATTSFLVAITIYQRLGGVFPLPDLMPRTILVALAAILVHFLMVILIWSVYILYHVGAQRRLSYSVKPVVRFFMLSFGLPFLTQPFAILTTGLLIQHGFSIFSFFLSGLFLVAYLTRKLSWLAESSRQQSRQLQKLEQLGRAIINSPPDQSNLSTLLADHIPNMFPSSRISIWLSPDQVLYQVPSDNPPISQEAWDWLVTHSQINAFLPKDPLPWEDMDKDHDPVIVTPILEVETNRPIGGINLELRTLAHPWDIQALTNLFPALQSLAAQIASAIYQSEIYMQTLAYQNITQELKLAGTIQASFLPNKFPSIPGWELAVSLQPARETSGDFFDVIELDNGRLGILIADVADKGVGPALYMALSRTLIRTYAEEYDAEPEVVFFATNNRLMRDARANLFVTAFYGILDHNTGTFTYSNAGHNPPFLLCASDGYEVKPLQRTGIPLGIEESTWSQVTIQITPGDVLLLYTDGVPDAQNEDGVFFDEDRLIEVARENSGFSAHELQDRILDEIHQFIGNAPQSDDITLMTLVRNPNPDKQEEPS
jgi:serine phosphatase RsbU (regulator of sigma subunit)